MTTPTAFAGRVGTRTPITVSLTIMLLCVFTGIAAVSAPAQDMPASDDAGWRIDFGPYLGYYDFDPVTQFDDGAMAGLRLGIHQDGWFRFETEFDEVYTRREPVGNAARQITLAAHGRFEPQRWRLAPSALLGIAFVMFDDSDNPDAFSEAYDLGLGLTFRVSGSWSLRTEYMMRYQRFRVRDASLPIDDPAATSELIDLWGSSIRLGAFYQFPTERNDQPTSYPIEFGLYAGYWSFNSVFRYQDDAVLGLRGRVGMFRWMSLQLELDQITTSNERTDDWAQTISFAMHGLFEARPEARWRPGILAGVSFMGADNRIAFDAISEGFDIGPSLRLCGSSRLSLQGDVLLRYQSVRVNDTDQNGFPTADGAVEYVWSYGIRLGVNVEL